MFCYHCGFHFDEKKLEEKDPSMLKFSGASSEGEEGPGNETAIEYVCPRCGHLIHHGHEEEDLKSLSRASHAQLQRGRNAFAKGMCALSIAVIAMITGLIFILLAYKVDSDIGGRHMSYSSPEFWIGTILEAITLGLLIYGGIQVAKGLTTKHMYTEVLKDINNLTFVQ